MRRSAGILLPIFSLPNKCGIGNFGDSAYRFVDFLAAAKQSYWQVLPLNPTILGDSPYQSPSAFSGNPYFIDFKEYDNFEYDSDDLTDWSKSGSVVQKTGFSAKRSVHQVHDQAESSGFCANHTLFHQSVNYSELFKTKPQVFLKAFNEFDTDNNEFKKFKEENLWLKDYCLFNVIKELQNNAVWNTWEKKYKFRDKKALEQIETAHSKKLDYYAFLQFRFFEQWFKLKEYANLKGVQIIGDIPIYVSFDSTDVWVNPELFELDKNLSPVRVAGCPPDDFSPDGQLWGNPLYNWEQHKATNYKWWIDRFYHNLKMYDILRIDHFRGFESYYAIDGNSETAKNGVWVKGPDKEFVKVINEWFNYPPIIAENLGFLTKEVYDLLDYSGYPGMVVLQFGVTDKTLSSEHLPNNYGNRLVAYTGTHDNDTSHGFYLNLSKKEKATARKNLHAAGQKNIGIKFAKCVLHSRADIAIVPMQDYLNLTSEARINTPSLMDGNNWRWRLDGKLLTNKLCKKILNMTANADR